MVSMWRSTGDLGVGLDAGEFRDTVMKGFICHTKESRLSRMLSEPPSDVRLSRMIRFVLLKIPQFGLEVKAAILEDWIKVGGGVENMGGIKRS